MLHSGPKTCASGFKCVAVSPPYYSQACLTYSILHAAISLFTLFLVPVNHSIKRLGDSLFAFVDLVILVSECTLALSENPTGRGIIDWSHFFKHHLSELNVLLNNVCQKPDGCYDSKRNYSSIQSTKNIQHGPSRKCTNSPRTDYILMVMTHNQTNEQWCEHASNDQQ